MKKTFYLVFLLASLISCNDDDNISEVSTTFNFNHTWDGVSVSNANFDNIIYTNANGEDLSITKLRYLISKIKFENSNGEVFVLDGYNLVDVTNNNDLSFNSATTIPVGNYSKVTFIFGFDNDDNYNGNFPDLNSASWNVPAMMGGGYHYMQLEGKFINNSTNEAGYAYHAIRAVNNSGGTQVFQDTFFEVNLGAVNISNNATFNIDMNIAEWFKGPNTWDLNVLNNMLMPNFDAQVTMYENGQNVFSLESVEQ